MLAYPLALAQDEPTCYAVLPDGNTTNLDHMCDSNSPQTQDMIPQFERLSLEEYYQRGVLPRPSDLYQQGEDAYGIGLIDEAIGIFSRVIEAQPDNYMALIRRAQSYSVSRVLAEQHEQQELRILEVKDYERAVEILESLGDDNNNEEGIDSEELIESIRFRVEIVRSDIE
jgi:tetratricopeptide (TPR) repeat protein